jgi:small GTP-binding protein
MKTIFHSLFAKHSEHSPPVTPSTGSGRHFSFFPFLHKDSEPKRVLLLGLDSVGKTTFLYQIRSSGHEVDSSTPTVGFNVETLQSKDVDFTCLDIGKCQEKKPLWQNYMENLAGIVFMVDSSDFERMEQAYEELSFFLKETKAPLLVIANKIDLPRARTLRDVIHGLHLHEAKDRNWQIIPTQMTLPESAKPCQEWIRQIVNQSDVALSGSLTESYGGITSRGYFGEKSPIPGHSPKSPPGTTSSIQNNPTLDKIMIDLEVHVQHHDQEKLELIWQDWLSRAENKFQDQIDDDTFLDQLEHYELTTWDHYTHLRIAYSYLVRYGIKEGYNLIETNIHNFIKYNPNATNGKSFHATLTRFWSHLMIYWMNRREEEDILMTSHVSSNDLEAWNEKKTEGNGLINGIMGRLRSGSHQLEEFIISHKNSPTASSKKGSAPTTPSHHPSMSSSNSNIPSLNDPHLLPPLPPNYRPHHHHSSYPHLPSINTGDGSDHPDGRPRQLSRAGLVIDDPSTKSLTYSTSPSGRMNRALTSPSSAKPKRPCNTQKDFSQLLSFIYRHRVPSNDVALSTVFHHYYSNEVLFHINARTHIVKPNIQSLPEIFTILHPRSASNATMTNSNNNFTSHNSNNNLDDSANNNGSNSSPPSSSGNKVSYFEATREVDIPFLESFKYWECS